MTILHLLQLKFDINSIGGNEHLKIFILKLRVFILLDIE